MVGVVVVVVVGVAVVLQSVDRAEQDECRSGSSCSREADEQVEQNDNTDRQAEESGKKQDNKQTESRKECSDDSDAAEKDDGASVNTRRPRE